MKTLTGSPKQIAWAEKIRDAAIELAEDGKRDGHFQGMPDIPKIEVHAWAHIVRWTLEGHVEASWFIENRDDLKSYAGWQRLDLRHLPKNPARALRRAYRLPLEKMENMCQHIISDFEV